MMRVSPPELAREFPGPHASNNVTFAPFLSSSSAVQPPNAPAPTTMTELREELPNVRGPIRYPPAAAEPFTKVRREAFHGRSTRNSNDNYALCESPNLLSRALVECRF